MIVLALIAATALFAEPPKEYDRVSPQVAAARVSKCGVGSVTVRADAELDSETLVLAPTAPITSEALACIDKAASFYDVELPLAAQAQFNAIREARAASWMVAESKKWLAAHDLLARLPAYTPGVTNDADFAHKIEALCKADGALSSSYGAHTLNPDWMRQRELTENEDTMDCLLASTSYTNFDLVFVGNARFAQ